MYLPTSYRRICQNALPGSFKEDNVLASVAGTTATKMRCWMHRYLKLLDRNQAHADVRYDGDPELKMMAPI